MGYKIDNDRDFIILHLQFANDILILCKKRWKNIRSLKKNLILFEMILNLRVTFYKSILVDVNNANLWLTEASVVLNCKIGRILFLYLALPVGKILGCTHSRILY